MKTNICFKIINQKAFSLIELMVTLVISTVISGMTAYIFLKLKTKSDTVIKKVDSSVDLSVFYKYINRDLSTVGPLSVGTLNLEASLPITGNRNFFAFYISYPINLLPKDQQTRTLKFSHTDARNGYIYFLQDLKVASKRFSVLPTHKAFPLYEYSGSQLFNNQARMSFRGSKIKQQHPQPTSMWAANNLMLFYTPLYFNKTLMNPATPVRLYSYLGVVKASEGAVFNGNFFGGLLNKKSPTDSAVTINSFKKVIANAPSVGGNKFFLYMKQVQWLTYFFQKGTINKGGKLYRCVNIKKVANFKRACTASTGSVILNNIKDISFVRDVDSADIKVILNLHKTGTQ